MNIPFFKPTLDSGEIDLIDEVLDGDGANKAVTLEEEFREDIGTQYALTTTNGNSALHLSMCALDLKRGDKVICSVNSSASAPEVIRHFDAEPIFTDINQDDFNIDPAKLEKTLIEHKHKKLRAIVVNHIAGQASDMDALYDLARANNVKVVEDASFAMGGTYQGEKIGSLKSDITTFSFSPHMLPNVTNGGVMTLNDDELFERAKLLRHHGMVKKDTVGLDYVYDIVDIGCRYGMSEIDAAVCLAQYRKVEAGIARRKEIADIYYKELEGTPHVTLPKKVRDHVYSLFIIKIDKNRDAFARELRERGVETGLHFIPMNLLSYYKAKYELKVMAFPNALTSYQQILSIPIYAAMSDQEVHYVCEQIKDIAKNKV
jgi:dTDP-4-amino-4,6-dideoxygalactose transaminase